MMEKKLIDITATFGTPLYVYDEQRIIDQVDTLKTSFTYPDLIFCYAMKANSNLAVLDTLRHQGIGVDCVSQGEMITALRAGFEPSKIRFTPTFASTEEIIFAIEQGIQLTVDSMQMVDWMLVNRPQTPMGLRMNPSVMAGAYEKTSVGHAKAKFGIGMNYVPALLDLIELKGLKINGLHIHSGSDILEASQFMQAVEVLLEVAPKFPKLEYIDLGSGFKVSYYPGDKATNIRTLGQIVSDRFSKFCTHYGSPLRLIFEPGKFIVSQAGRFLVTCTGVKENGGITFAGVDSGFNHLIRPMFYGAYHTINNLSNPSGSLLTYDVVGNICETDTFASDRSIAQIRPGDILEFENAGAYCFSMSSPYNSRPRPAEVYFRSDGSTQLIRRRETIEDILALQINL
ncbi:MAG: diaminopimelate decarboxylase [Saprospiraceae bacterium]